MTFREIIAGYDRRIEKLEKEICNLKKENAELKRKKEIVVEKIVEVPVERKVEMVCPDGRVYYSEPESEIALPADSGTEETPMLDELIISKPKRSKRKKEEHLVEE